MLKIIRALALVLLLTVRPWAAFAYVAGGDWADVAPATSLTLSSVTYADDETVFIVVTYGSPTRVVETFTDGTNTYTYIGTVSDATNGQSAAIFVLKDATAGTYTLNFGLASACTYRALGYRRYTGLDLAGTGQFLSSQPNNVSGTDGIVTSSVAPSAQPSIVFAATVEVSGSGSTPAAGTGHATRALMSNWDSSIGKSMTEDKRVTALTATTATFTPSTGSNSYLVVGAIYPEPGAIGGGGGGSASFRSSLLGVGK